MFLLLLSTALFWAGETAATKKVLSHGRGVGGNACGDSSAVGDCRAPLQCLAGGGQVTLSYTCPSTLLVCCTFTSGCGGSTRGRVSEWRNPSYPNTDVDLPDLCTFSITPASDTCYIRAEFTELTAPSAVTDACQDNLLTIYNQKEGSGSSLCGAFTGYSTFIRVKPSWLWFSHPVQMSLRIRTTPYKFSVKFTQLRCADVKSFSVSSRSRRDALFNFNPILGSDRKKPRPNFIPSKSELLAYKLAAQQALLGSQTTMATVSYPASTVGLENELEKLAQDLTLAVSEQTGITDGLYQTETSSNFMNDIDLSTNIFPTSRPEYTNTGPPGRFSQGIGANSFGTTDASFMSLNNLDLASTMTQRPINFQTDVNGVFGNQYPNTYPPTDFPNGFLSSYLPTEFPNAFSSSYPPTELLQNTNSFYGFSTPATAGLNPMNTFDPHLSSHPNFNQWSHSQDDIHNIYNHLSTPPSHGLVGATAGSTHPLDMSALHTASPIGSSNWHSTLAPSAMENYLSSFGPLGNLNRPVNLNRPGILFRPNGRFNYSSNLEKLTASYLNENLAASMSNFGGNTLPSIYDSSITNHPTRPNSDYVSMYGTKNKFPPFNELGTSEMNNNYLTNLGDFSHHSLQLLNILASTTISPQIAISLSGSSVKPHITGSFNNSGYFPFSTQTSTSSPGHKVMRPTLITIPLREKGGQKITSQVAGNTGLAHTVAGNSVSPFDGDHYISTVTESSRPSLQPPGNGIFPSRGNAGTAYPPGMTPPISNAGITHSTFGTSGVTQPAFGATGVTQQAFGASGVTVSPFDSLGTVGTSSFPNNVGNLGYDGPSITGLTSIDSLDESLSSILNSLNLGTSTGALNGLNLGTSTGALNGLNLGTTTGALNGLNLGTTTGALNGLNLGTSTGALNNLNLGTTTGAPAHSFPTLTSTSRPTLPYSPGSSWQRPITTMPRPPIRQPIATRPLLSPEGAGASFSQAQVSRRPTISTIFQSFLNKQPVTNRSQSFSTLLTRLAQNTALSSQSYPFMGLSVLKTAQGSYHVCGAVLISSSYALTTARCLLRKGLAGKYEAKVIFGSDHSILADNPTFEAIYSHSVSRKVEKIIFHPMVDHTTLRYDLAVLRLARPYTDIAPARLPAREAEFSGMGGELVGWSLTEAPQPPLPQTNPSVVFNSLDVAILSNADCSKAWTGLLNPYDYTGTAPVIYDEMVCTRTDSANSGSCINTEGGAVIKKGASGENILVGILSGAHHGCATDGSTATAAADERPDIATRMSALLDWLDAVTTEYRYPCGVDLYTFTYRECVL